MLIAGRCFDSELIYKAQPWPGSWGGAWDNSGAGSIPPLRSVLDIRLVDRVVSSLGLDSVISFSDGDDVLV